MCDEADIEGDAMNLLSFKKNIFLISIYYYYSMSRKIGVANFRSTTSCEGLSLTLLKW